jgi:RNA 2',3'-cyclic 3'-phosphodiesterase
VPTARLFIAIDLPLPLREQLNSLRAPVPGFVWTRPEQMHLTLRFLGDVEIAQREALEAALARVSVEPFFLPVGGFGTFPLRGPARVLWVGIDRGHSRLQSLRQQVDDAVLAAGIAPDVRHFQPHVTLARIRDEAPPDAVARFLETHPDFEASPFRVSSFALYASELRPAGAVHTPWRVFPLGHPLPAVAGVAAPS